MKHQDLISKMTLEEKASLMSGKDFWQSVNIDRLNIPSMFLADGPNGIRKQMAAADHLGLNESIKATCFPTACSLASTWNTELSLGEGKRLSREAKMQKVNVLLGPGVNICRTPLNGRSFEYMGEDPYLSGRMGVQYVKGVQQQGVAVCVKHYALNNNEHERYQSNANVDERTLREIYLPAFEAAITEGGAWTLMGGYNLVRGQHACHNQYLMNEVLKGEWGFDGAIISDWGGTQSTMEAIYNGLDLEYGTWTDGLQMGATNAYDNYMMANPYQKLIEEGKVGTKELDDKVRRVLRLIFRTTMNPNRPFGALNSEKHVETAISVGAEGIVLLQNNPLMQGKKQVGAPILPINLAETKTILVVGENAVKMMMERELKAE